MLGIVLTGVARAGVDRRGGGHGALGTGAPVRRYECVERDERSEGCSPT